MIVQSIMSNQTGNFADLLKTICDKHISTLVIQFTSKVAESTKVPQEELIETWNSLNPEYIVDIKEHDKKEVKKKGKTEKVEKAQCEYILTRGNKNRCNNKVSDKSTTGKYCAKHAKIEEKEDESGNDSDSEKAKNKKQVKESKKKEVKSKENDEKESKKEVTSKKESNKKITNEDKKEFTFNPRHNKELDVYVDKKSGFIFDKETKKIYGKVVNDEINKLSNDDMQFLNSNNIQYDAELFDLRHIEEEGPDDEQDD